MVGKQLFGEAKQIVEVNHPLGLEIALVTTIGGSRQVLAIRLGDRGGLAGLDGTHFPTAEDGQQIARPQRPIADANFTQCRPGFRFLIAPVANREPLGVAQSPDMPAQYPDAK